MALSIVAVVASVGAVTLLRSQRATWTAAWERVARAHGLALRQDPLGAPAAALPA